MGGPGVGGSCIWDWGVGDLGPGWAIRLGCPVGLGGAVRRVWCLHLRDF